MICRGTIVLTQTPEQALPAQEKSLAPGNQRLPCDSKIGNQKTNIEPENPPFEKENHLPNLYFWVPYWFSGVYLLNLLTLDKKVFDRIERRPKTSSKQSVS